MKNICYYIAIALFITACGGDDDTIEESSQTYLEAAIVIVNQDGVAVGTFNCVDPFQDYSIKISVTAQGEGDPAPTRVDYTVNGSTASITFLNAEPKFINIELVEGLNTVQLVRSGLTSTANLFPLPEFEVIP